MSTHTSSKSASVFFTVSEVAKNVRLSERQIRRLIAHGDLVVHRIGRAIRISASDLDQFLRRRRKT